jgi:hypothetical protein
MIWMWQRVFVVVKLVLFLTFFTQKFMFYYSRGGQSTALQRLSEAPVSNFGRTTIFVRKIPKIDTNYVTFKEKQGKKIAGRNTIS